MSDLRPFIAVTVDVECWGQSVLNRSLPILPHAADNARRVLALLAACNAKATLFVLGKFAERHPDVVREAHAGGHEIASHGYGHVEVFKQTPAAFRADLDRSRDILEGLIGESVRGYRAPVFSIGRKNLWALEVLADAGFEYDASIFPFDGPRYGIGDWPTEPVRLKLSADREIVEYPATVIQGFGKRWPIAGGGYARLLPGSVLGAAFQRAARKRLTPPVFYCHPYELDPTEIARCYPQVHGKRRWHQSLGRSGFERKMRRLLNRFRGVSIRDALSASGALGTKSLEIIEDRRGASAGSKRADRAANDRDTAYRPEAQASGASMYS